MVPEISPPLPGWMSHGVSGKRATVQPQLVLVPVMVTALVQALVRAKREKLLSIRTQIDALRTLNANVRVQV